MSTTIPARSGAHVKLQQYQKVKITNPSGLQVVDCWAFPLTEPPTWMAMAQTRSKLLKLIPSVNDVLIDTRRQPVLKLVEDSSSGTHDMLFPPCDEWRYKEAGVPDHDSCGANLRMELSAYVTNASEERSAGIGGLVELESSVRRWGWTPEPFNLFMNVPWAGDKGELKVKRPVCKANDCVVLEAMVECLVVMSACPNDLMDTNGGSPSAAAYEIVA
ncbi:hypothetical protein B0A50_04996 [Salinomyces thailandicus]|uniref:DUF1989 domain-containing protein n=1 Tax=Salinomyces thailandicus TaxID=706561 RepID=A0A4U0TYC5_9PEZI|nr:hypothetical protein B0A50_04996 [Salinomyces thailandica]